MGAYKYLMIHCTATIQGTDLKPKNIERMHMGAKKQPNGTIRFMGKNYNSISALPNVLVGGIPAKDSNGRGWDRVGYSKAFFENGMVHDFVEHNNDNWISSNELTYGATGFNSTTKHFVYAGGLAKDYSIVGGRRNHEFMNTMTEQQEQNLIDAVFEEIRQNPAVKIIGHNQVAVKGCPCFDVRAWCQKIGVKIENIDTRKLLVNLKNDKNTFQDPDQPFLTRKDGDAFRKWVNDNHLEYAKQIDLDRSGSHTNAYILKAWKHLGSKYINL